MALKEKIRQEDRPRRRKSPDTETDGRKVRNTVKINDEVHHKQRNSIMHTRKAEKEMEIESQRRKKIMRI